MSCGSQSYVFRLPWAAASAKVADGKFPLGRALQWDALAFLPLCTDIDYKLLHTHTHIKICIHPPTPDPSPPLLWTASLTSGSVTSDRNSGCGTGWLLAGAGLLPLWHSRVFMVYVLLCWGVFPVLTLYSPRSIVWGLFFFSSPSSCYAVFFLPLSTYISLLIIPCMIVYVTNNKEPWTEPIKSSDGHELCVFCLGRTHIWCLSVPWRALKRRMMPFRWQCLRERSGPTASWITLRPNSDRVEGLGEDGPSGRSRESFRSLRSGGGNDHGALCWSAEAVGGH